MINIKLDTTYGMVTGVLGKWSSELSQMKCVSFNE
jgi:hypothetical protein